MRRLISTMVFACAGAVAAQQPMIRAHLEPAGNVTVGAPVRLVVTVLVPNYFTGSPDFPEIELENAIVVLPQETPLNSSERAQGVTYAGITEVYTIYPQQPGDFALPPAQIDVHYAIAPPKTTLAHLTLPPLHLHADIPAAAKGLDYFLPTPRLTIQQRWSPQPNRLRVGDTVERTVTVTATKMQAMLIPPLPFDAPDGIRVYQEEASVQDKKSNRNEFLFGQRTQAAKYLIQKEGSYTLPAIELKWWNLSTRRLMTAVLPPVHLEAAANPTAATELPPEQPAPIIEQVKTSFWTQHRRQLYLGAAWMLVALLLLWIAWRWLPRLYRSAQRWREQQKESEHAYFHALLKACSANQPVEAYTALLRWFNRCFPGEVIEEIAPTRNSELTAEIDKLGALLFGSAGERAPWSGHRLAESLKKWRNQRTKNATRENALARLNP